MNIIIYTHTQNFLHLSHLHNNLKVSTFSMQTMGQRWPDRSSKTGF